MAGSTVIERIAANDTEKIAPYATDFKKPCGIISRHAMAATMMVAEKTTVCPAVITVLRTAALVL